MRKRDLAILMLSAFAIFFSLQHEGDFSFREAWFHLSDKYPIKYETERLPPPLVADLNGDGKKEILVATHDAKIQVLEPHALCVDEGFSEARLLAEVSLLPDKIRVASGRRPVAMATGVIGRTYKTGQPQKQVLVVVSSGWSVMCFDHNLKQLWENNLQEDFPHNAHHREIAISISNYTLKHGHSDLFEGIGMAERNAERQRRSANEKEASENSGTVNLRHFAFYAFDGRKGGLRWSRKNESTSPTLDDSWHNNPFEIVLSNHVESLPRIISLSHVELQFECREFRESILGVMPHHWDGREDTLLKLSHFKRHKRKTLKRVPGKAATYHFHKPEEHHPPGKDDSKKFSNLIGKAAKYAGSAKSKKLHLQEGGLHADINRDGVLDHVQAVGGNGAEQTVVSGSMAVLRPYVTSLEVATPFLIPRSDGHRHHGDVIFLTNRGEVTAYSPGLHGHDAVWQWQLFTDATWSNLPSPSGMMEGGTVVPTLKAISLLVHDTQHMILAAGDQTGVIISPGGSILTTVDLPAPPTHALISEDFSNDGLTDLILVTSNGVYGFVQTRQPGALFFSTLVGCLLLVMGVILVTQHLNSIKGKPRASSGPR
ncbi:hypothetical protein CRYUN_Cryun24cG0011800 [Craigia yunnanensis]